MIQVSDNQYISMIFDYASLMIYSKITIISINIWQHFHTWLAHRWVQTLTPLRNIWDVQGMALYSGHTLPSLAQDIG